MVVAEWLLVDFALDHVHRDDDVDDCLAGADQIPGWNYYHDINDDDDDQEGDDGDDYYV